MLSFALSLYLTLWIPDSEATGQCDTRVSSYGKALKKHTYKQFKANSPTDCVIQCEQELVCQSYNYAVGEKVCELNNRSKEARPNDYMRDPARIYMTIHFNREPLGSIPEVPAESCKEIKASEGSKPLCRNWLKPTSSSNSTLEICYAETEVYSMVFPTYSNKNYAKKENAIKRNLTEFTICFFVKLGPGVTGYQTVYSYAVSSSYNEIYVALFEFATIGLVVNNHLREFGKKITDSKWHHMCVTWKNTGGVFQLYMDGQLSNDGKGLKNNHVIPHGGTVVFGQDQDRLGGGFELDDSFGPGELADLNMWSRVLSASEIGRQYHDCEIPQGSVHAWSQFKNATFGPVQVKEP